MWIVLRTLCAEYPCGLSIRWARTKPRGPGTLRETARNAVRFSVVMWRVELAACLLGDVTVEHACGEGRAQFASFLGKVGIREVPSVLEGVEFIKAADGVVLVAAQPRLVYEARLGLKDGVQRCPRRLVEGNGDLEFGVNECFFHIAESLMLAGWVRRKPRRP
jgi:hypothetical protein